NKDPPWRVFVLGHIRIERSASAQGCTSSNSLLKNAHPDFFQPAVPVHVRNLSKLNQSLKRD
ncbi:MAG: hypothetical protein Q8J78_08120, partial [Moraxellaceae bacterium]|nr:hypothetical protein [Moraxellaceae bacterium]